MRAGWLAVSKAAWQPGAGTSLLACPRYAGRMHRLRSSIGRYL